MLVQDLWSHLQYYIFPMLPLQLCRVDSVLTTCAWGAVSPPPSSIPRIRRRKSGRFQVGEEVSDQRHFWDGAGTSSSSPNSINRICVITAYFVEQQNCLQAPTVQTIKHILNPVILHLEKTWWKDYHNWTDSLYQQSPKWRPLHVSKPVFGMDAHTILHGSLSSAPQIAPTSGPTSYTCLEIWVQSQLELKNLETQNKCKVGGFPVEWWVLFT